MIEREKQNVREDIECRENQKRDDRLDVLQTGRCRNSNNL